VRPSRTLCNNDRFDRPAKQWFSSLPSNRRSSDRGTNVRLKSSRRKYTTVIRLLSKRSFVWAPLLVVTTFCATAVAGNTQRDAARAAARSAGYDGIHAYESGDMAVAVDKLGRAFDVVKIPTLGLWYARALAKNGNLVEASERYGEVMRLEITEGKVKEQKQAQADAASELEALKPKIPTLTLTVAGATDDCQVTLDGGAISLKLLALATPINPGSHRVQAVQGGETVEATFTIAEGQKKAIALKIKPPKATAPVGTPPASKVNSGAQSGAADSDSRNAKSKGSTQKTIGWITLGVGGVATVAGVVTGILSVTKRGQLDSSNNCVNTVCLSAERDSLNSYNQMRTISTIGLVAGAVGIGVGTTLLLSAPKPKEAGVSAWLGIGSVGMTGSF
jgi:hypothetical protein